MAPIRTSKTSTIPTRLIAPCGMNCRLCRAYTREKNACPGCRADDSNKPKTRVVCQIKTCEKIRWGAAYCFKCDRFPCDRLNHLDERYRTRYGMSMIENLADIKKSGIRRFIQSEKKKWACSRCGQLLCVHKSVCLTCGHKWR
jgi:hypothetical protein